MINKIFFQEWHFCSGDSVAWALPSAAQLPAALLLPLTLQRPLSRSTQGHLSSCSSTQTPSKCHITSLREVLTLLIYPHTTVGTLQPRLLYRNILKCKYFLFRSFLSQSRATPGKQERFPFDNRVSPTFSPAELLDLKRPMMQKLQVQES